jgi:hypothetical protein
MNELSSKRIHWTHRMPVMHNVQAVEKVDLAQNW